MPFAEAVLAEDDIEGQKKKDKKKKKKEGGEVEYVIYKDHEGRPISRNLLADYTQFQSVRPFGYKMANETLI